MPPLISVIVPIYKVENYLCRCIDSILAQTYRNLEIILVDDGSPDHCGAMCDEYAQQDERIRVIHKENGGLSSARNAGIDICQGDYISFIDSDDFVSPVFIEALYEGIQSTNAEISSLIHAVFFKDGEDGTVTLAESVANHSVREVTSHDAVELLLYQHLPNGAQWRLYQRDIFRELRFPLGYLFEDVATTHRAFILAKKIALIDAGLYAYRVRETGIVRQAFSQAKMVCIPISKKILEDVDKFDKTLKNAAKSRAFAINYQVFLQVPKADIESKRLLWNEITKYRKSVLLDRNKKVRLKNRIGAVVTYLGMENAWRAGRILNGKA